MTKTMLAAALALLLSPMTARADADEKHGERLFLQCRACHTLKAGEPNKVGPNLSGVVGAKAAGKADFVYSDALKAANITWTPDQLDAWIKQPSAKVPGTKMVFAGVPKDQDRADLIAYLTTATKP